MVSWLLGYEVGTLYHLTSLTKPSEQCLVSILGCIAVAFPSEVILPIFWPKLNWMCCQWISVIYCHDGAGKTNFKF